MSNQLGPGLPSQAAVIICFQLCCLLFNITFWPKVSPDWFSTFRSSLLPQFYLQIYLNSVIWLYVPSQLLSEWCNNCDIMFGLGTYRNIDWTVLSWSGFWTSPIVHVTAIIEKEQMKVYSHVFHLKQTAVKFFGSWLGSVLKQEQ